MEATMANGNIYINVELQADGSVKTNARAEGIKVAADADERDIVATLAWLYACAAAEAIHAGAKHIVKNSRLDAGAAKEIITHSTSEALRTYNDGPLVTGATEVAQ
jgi:hypothetical protein